jgi:anaerobic ribonucleoside-triphosphate reductase
MVGLGQKRPKMLDHDRRCRGRVGEGRWEANIIVERSRDEKDYIKASNAATGSKFDANANVTRKNIVTLGQELYKENNIKQNRYIMQDKIRSMYGKDLASQYIKDLESHVLYKHDESGTPGYPYCVAITMYPFLVSGLTELGGVSIAPTDLKSFCGEFINLVYSISSQFMGAVATPEFLMYMDYFIRRDYGDDYLSRLDEVVENNRKARTLTKVIDNCFQQVVHSMNMPAGNRGYQTVFWNISYFDKPYFEGVFSDFRFPDGTAPQWETLSWLQKHFMRWFNEERNRYVLTFPVETMALLTDGGNDYADKEYADFTAEMWSKGHSFFCYISNSPDSLSSCCRLRNSLNDLEEIDEDHNHTTHQYSMGTASVSTGSKSVMTINLNRLIQDAARKYFREKMGIDIKMGVPISPEVYHKEELYNYIREAVTIQTERVHKYQTAFNEIIKDFLKADMLDVYNAGFIDMRRQYLTVGINGMTEAAEFLGLKVSPNPDYNEFVNMLLETINICNRKDKTKETMFNTEFVPAENLAGKNYKWDQKDGYYVSPHHVLYSSYFYNPEDTSLSMIDKFKLHGEDYVKYLDGGSALHMNIQEHLTKEQYRQLLNVAAHYGTNYFTFNCRNTICNQCGYISKDTLNICPKCDSRNIDHLTRVIGYLKRISSFAEIRQDEAIHRFYDKKPQNAKLQA